MKLRVGFPDIESVVCTLLEPVADTFTRVPEQILDKFILVRRIGGANDEFQDYPLVQVQAFAVATSTQSTPRPVAFAMGEDIRQLMLASRRTKVGDVVVDDVTTITPPDEHDDENSDIRCVVATYELIMRRPYRR